MDGEVAFVGLCLAIVNHIENDGVVLVHLSRGLNTYFVLKGDGVAGEQQGVFREIFQEDFIAVAEGVGDDNLAAHSVHHDENAVLAVAQVTDFQLSDFVGQTDGLGRRLVFGVDFFQGDATRGLETVVAAKQWGTFLLASSQSHKATD